MFKCNARCSIIDKTTVTRVLLDLSVRHSALSSVPPPARCLLRCLLEFLNELAKRNQNVTISRYTRVDQFPCCLPINTGENEVNLEECIAFSRPVERRIQQRTSFSRIFQHTAPLGVIAISHQTHLPESERNLLPFVFEQSWKTLDQVAEDIIAHRRKKKWLKYSNMSGHSTERAGTIIVCSTTILHRRRRWDSTRDWREDSSENTMLLSSKMPSMDTSIEVEQDSLVEFEIASAVSRTDCNEVHFVSLDEAVLEDDDVHAAMSLVHFHPAHNKLCYSNREIVSVSSTNKGSHEFVTFVLTNSDVGLNDWIIPSNHFLSLIGLTLRVDECSNDA